MRQVGAKEDRTDAFAIPKDGLGKLKESIFECVSLFGNRRWKREGVMTFAAVPGEYGSRPIVDAGIGDGRLDIEGEQELLCSPIVHEKQGRDAVFPDQRRRGCGLLYEVGVKQPDFLLNEHRAAHGEHCEGRKQLDDDEFLLDGHSS